MQTFNADADANISKWSRETTVSYLGTKIRVQKIESRHYVTGKLPPTFK